MPLELSDPRWNDLRSAYGDTTDVVAWLTEAYREGELSCDRLGDLINEVQHQGDTSTAMYAVAAHLIALAQRFTPTQAFPLLTQVGLIYASVGRRDSVPCPAFLQQEFSASAPIAAQQLSELLPLARQFDEFKWAVAALAGLMGHQPFARFLDGLDLYEGRFHHASIEGPFPNED